MIAIAAVEACVRADIPVLLWGAPGVGKTAALRALAAQSGAHLEVLIGSTLDPTDLGYQIPDGRELRHVPPAWGRRLRRALDDGRPAWLLLDELSCAPPAVQAALLRLVHERQVGDLDLAGCRILAAANPADQGAGAMDLAPAMANRWCHVQWAVDPPSWCRGVLDGWGRGAASPAEARARQLISAHIRSVPAALIDCPEDPDQAAGAWPSPRSWEALARALGALTADPDRVRTEALSETGFVLACSLIGRGAAGGWSAWVADCDLPDPEDLLRGKAPLPERADLQMSCLDAVAIAATDPSHPDLRARWDRAWDLVASVRSDIQIGAAKLLLDRRPHGACIPEIVEGIAAAIQGAR